jgi:hypothetical protein
MHVYEFEGNADVLRKGICWMLHTKEKWQNCCSNVKKFEEKSWQRDGLMDEAIDTIIIH